MAEAAVFIGWDQPARGREQKALSVFNEAIELYRQLEQSRQIESFEAVLLEPHGGDLGGFMLLRGSRQQMDSLRANPDFQRVMLRAGLVVDSFGVVDAYPEEGLSEQMSLYQQQLSELT